MRARHTGRTLFPLLAGSLLLTAPHILRASETSSVTVNQGVVVTHVGAEPLVKRAAGLLIQEIGRRNQGQWQVLELKDQQAALPVTGLVMVLETPGFHPLSPRIKASPVTKDVPGPEGFIIKHVPTSASQAILLAGSDAHGVLFGAGKLLRLLEIYPDRIGVPPMDISMKPRFPIRGFRDAGRMPFFKERTFLPELFKGYLEDFSLWGGNLFMEELNWSKVPGAFAITESLGLKLGLYWPSNGMDFEDMGRVTMDMMAPQGEKKKMRLSWLVCPSTAAGRKALLDQFERFATNYPHLDLWTSANVDNGGCFCEQCAPWGKTHLLLMQEEAAILRKHHPGLKTAATLVSLRPPDIEWTRNYVKTGQAKPWLNYLGVAANTEHPYDYEPLIKDGLPPIYADLFTHWDKMPFVNNCNPRPPFDATLWNRGILMRSLWERRGGPAMMPRRLQGMIRQMAAWKGDGACPYNHGQLHDDTSKYYALQLLFDPEADLARLSGEFARYYFGPKSAPLVSEAMQLMETNWAKPVIDNSDIPKVLDLVEKAVEQVPRTYRDWNWRLHAFRLRAVADRVAQIAAQADPMSFEDAFHQQVLPAEAAEADPKSGLEKGLAFLNQWRVEKYDPLQAENDRLLTIAAECDRKTAELIIWHPGAAAAILPGMFPKGWPERYRQMARKALASGDQELMAQTLAVTFNYQYAGKDGFYDFSGDDRPVKRPHFVRLDNNIDQTPVPAYRSLAGPWRMSQRLAMIDGFLGGSNPRQTIEYSGLNPRARYRFKFVHVGNSGRFGPSRLVMAGKKLGEIKAEGPGQYVFEVPPELTAGGKLTVQCELANYDFFRGITEAWLYPYKGGHDVHLPFDVFALDDRLAELQGNKGPADGNSLIDNGHFERLSPTGAMGAKGWPLLVGPVPGWQCKGDVSLSETGACTGRRSLRFGPGSGMIEKWISPTPGTTIVLSMQVNVTSGSNGCRFEARMEGVTPKGDIPNFPSQIIAGPADGNYRQVTVRWKLPPDAAKVLVRLMATVPDKTKVLVDDITLIPLDE